MLSVILILIFTSHAQAEPDLTGLVQQVDQITVPSNFCEPSEMPAMFEGFPFDLARHKCLFAQDYAIAGASISAGGGVSPVNVLASASDSKTRPLMLFEPGTASGKHVPDILNLDPSKVRTLFAYDLFFWDGLGADCDKSVENVKKVLAWARSGRVNLVLGNIPLLPAKLDMPLIGQVLEVQPTSCGARLNREIAKCADQEFCFLVDNDKKLKEIEAAGGLDIGGRKFTNKDLRPDGLHFSRTGAIVAAELIADSIDQKPKNCP
jgi:lysophospholipase L1-like esterase